MAPRCAKFRFRCWSMLAGVLGGFVVAVLATPLPAVVLEVHNRYGDVRVRVVNEPDAVIRPGGMNREPTEQDTRIVRRSDRILVSCEPPDQQSMDLDIQLPSKLAPTVVDIPGQPAAT